jgi:hypothetical protein
MRINADPGLAPGQTLSSLKIEFLHEKLQINTSTGRIFENHTDNTDKQSSTRIIYVYIPLQKGDTIECKITGV